MKLHDVALGRTAVRESIAVFGLISLVVVLLALPAASLAPGRDSGIFLYIGQGILHGEVPYRDAWDHQPPLVFFVNALGLALAGGRIWGPWLVDVLALVVAGVLSYGVLKALHGRTVAAGVTLLWMLTLPDLMERGNFTETYTLPLQFAALFLAVRSLAPKTSFRRYLWLGILVGLAFALRQNHISTFAAVFLVLVRRTWSSAGPGGIGKAVGGAALGIAAALAPLVVYFVWHGAWHSLIDAAFTYNFAYTENDTLGRLQVIGLGIERVPWSYGALLVWLVALVRRLIGLRPPAGARGVLLDIVIVGVPLEMVVSTVSGRTYPHYFILWLPLMAVAVAELFGFLSERARRADRAGRLAAVGLLGLAVAAGFSLRFRALEDRYRERSDPLTDLRTRTAVQWIRENSNPEDPVLIYGTEPNILVLTGRRCPTRFFFQAPLVTRGYSTDPLVGDFLAQLQHSPPAVIIDTAHPSLPPLDPGARARWLPSTARNARTYMAPPAAMVAFFAWVEREYRSQVTENGWTLYLRKAAKFAERGPEL